MCEECGNEPAFSFSFFPDPLERLRVEKLRQEFPHDEGGKALTGEALERFLEGPSEVAEAMDIKADPYTEKMTCRLTGNCTTKTEMYFVEFEKFFESPTETVKWLAHLEGKGWVNWDDFMRTMRRLRKLIR